MNTTVKDYQPFYLYIVESFVKKKKKSNAKD